VRLVRRRCAKRSAVAVVAAAAIVLLGAASTGASDGFVATSVTAISVAAGGSAPASQTVHLDPLPKEADVVLALDLTGSMQSALDQAKAEASQIVDTLQSDFGASGTVRFAVAHFEDYPQFETNTACTNDQPWTLTHGFTEDAATVNSAVQSLQLAAGCGGDAPESYFRAFYETARLPWASGAERFLIVLGDNTGHDPNQAATFADCPNSSPVDPGDGTSGPLSATTAIKSLTDANVKLSFVHYQTESSSVTIACHTELAEATGGTAVVSGGDGTLTTKIEQLVTQGAQHVDSLTVTARNLGEGAPFVADWLSFSGLPTTVDLGNSGQDLPFTVTVKPPADTPPTGPSDEPYHVAVDVVADGITRTYETLDITVRTPLAGLQISATPTSVGVGIDQVKIGDIPPAWLAFYAGSTLGAPVGSTPVGSTPVGSTPVGSTPVGSTPVGSTPVGSTPVGSTPVGSTPVGSTGLLDLPVGSTPVGSTALSTLLLSQIPLCGDVPLPGTTQTQCQADGATWPAVLTDTTFAGKPLNTLSLADVITNTDAKNRLKALPLKDVSFATSLFKSVRWGSLLLGPTTLGSLEGGFDAWCGSTGLIPESGGDCTGATSDTSVLQMDVADHLGSAPVGSTPVGSTPVGSTPVGSTPVGSTSITASRLALVRLSDAHATVDGTTYGPDSVVTCDITQSTCATLGDAFKNNALVPGLKFSAPALVAAMNALPCPDDATSACPITINDILVAVLGAAGFPWESLPVQGLQPYSLTQPHVSYTLQAMVDCSVLTDFSFAVRLPNGFFPVGDSAKLKLGDGTPISAGPPQVLQSTAISVDSTLAVTTAASLGKLNAYQWDLPCGTTDSLVPAVLTFDAYVGLRLGTFSTDAAVRAGTFVLPGPGGPAANVDVTVHQNGEPTNDDQSKAMIVNPDTLVVGHLFSSGDQDFYKVKLDGLPRGTKVSVFLKVPPNSDFDLTVSRPATQSFFSSPVGSTPIGSTPIEDTGVGFASSNNAVPPETLQDIPVGSTPVGSTPVGSTPVGSTSTNRGAANEAAQIITTGEGGVATIGISGYNGAASSEPYVLRVQETPPPPLPANCPARAITLKSSDQGSLPSSLPASTKSLFLVNKQRLSAVYGSSAVGSLLKALNTLAARSEVAGTVLPVDGNAAVRSAYAAWDAKPCDVNLANGVVRSINDVVASYRNAGLPSLHYIVLLGSDEALPMARTPDPVTLSPEENVASDLAFTTNGLTVGNALYTSAAQNNILTDGAYGAFSSIPWLGHDLLLPQVSISRLIETPADMLGQVNRYLASSGLAGSPQTGPGVLNPSGALATGYDFLADGSARVRANLLARFTGLTSTDTIGGNAAITPVGGANPWTADNIRAGFLQSSSAASIGSLNAHYNHYELEAADGSTLATTGDVTAALASRILFTMGCHGGLNVADTLGGATGKFLDWPEQYARKLAAMYIANTGFGYGDTTSVALSERLMSLYASNLHSDASSVGEQWVAALQQYFATAGAYDVYDEKVMQETTFFGLPFWHFSTAGTGAAAPTSLTTSSHAGTGVQSASVSFPGTGTTTQDQFGLYRPILPITSKEVTSSSLPARGIWINSLATSDVADSAKLGMPTIDLGAHEPKPGVPPIFFPASPFMLEHSNVFGRQRDYVNVSSQFRPVPTTSDPRAGVRRDVVSAGLEIFYSNSTDVIPPLISEVHVSGVTAGSAVIQARITDNSGTVVEAKALVNDGTWHPVILIQNAGDPTLWEGTATGLVIEPEVFVEANDGPNVAYSANKGSNFTSTNSGFGTGPQILIKAPAGTYQLNQSVPASYQCLLGGSPLPSNQCVGTAANGSPIDTSTTGVHTFVVTALDADGTTVLASLQRTYFVWSFGGFLPPILNPPALNSVNAGSSVPIKFSLGGNQGLQIFAPNSPASRQISCTNEQPMPGAPTVPAGQSSLSYTASTDQYTYAWKTDATWAGQCRTLYVTFRDGVVHAANFKLTK
jgi:hypothetical protein